MSLSTAHHATPDHRTLPAEIISDIVDEACRTLDAPSISSIALTSDALRSRANKARFSEIIPFRSKPGGGGQDMDDTVRRVRTFADMIRRGQSITTMVGVCTFVTSFVVQMVGYREEVMPALEDGNLAYIFNNLFQTDDTTGTRSLSLYVYRWSRRDGVDIPSADTSGDTGYDGLIWTAINPELLRALEGLLRRSQLNRLSLEATREIPRDFMLRTRIKHLCLRRVSVGLSRTYAGRGGICAEPERGYRAEDRETERRREPVLLESLEIDGSVSTVDLRLIAHPDSDMPASLQDTFPCLIRLSVDVRHSGTIMVLNEVLHNALTLQELCVELWDHRQDYTAIEYGHLKHLWSISLASGGGTHLAAVTHLLNRNIPASVTEFRIMIYLPSSSLPTIERYLRHIGFNMLDEDLIIIHPYIVAIEHIVIEVETEQAVAFSGTRMEPKDAEDLLVHVNDQFPLLREKKGDGMEVTCH